LGESAVGRRLDSSAPLGIMHKRRSPREDFSSVAADNAR
jgi:hypothetical protein